DAPPYHPPHSRPPPTPTCDIISSLFHPYRPTRNIPSFPTRRSSDLKNFTGLDAPFEPPIHPALVLPTHLKSLEACSEQLSEHARSEEHTSELQSLRHLVCRLLLEKKKLMPTGGLDA